jgi:hypothetical protein
MASGSHDEDHKQEVMDTYKECMGRVQGELGVDVNTAAVVASFIFIHDVLMDIAMTLGGLDLGNDDDEGERWKRK